MNKEHFTLGLGQQSNCPNFFLLLLLLLEER